MNDLEYYKKLKYKMIVEFHPDDNAYFVRFPDLPGCIADGDTPEKAVKTALKVKDEWLETAYEAGWTIPEATTPIEASGRTTVRTPRYLHEKLLDTAEQEGVSLNQLILSYLAEGLERASVLKRVEAAIEELRNQIDKLEQNVPRIEIKHLALGSSWPEPPTIGENSRENYWRRTKFVGIKGLDTTPGVRAAQEVTAEGTKEEYVQGKFIKGENDIGGRA